MVVRSEVEPDEEFSGLMRSCVSDVGDEVYSTWSDEGWVEGGEVVGCHEDDSGGGGSDSVEGVEETGEGYAGLIAMMKKTRRGSRQIGESKSEQSERRRKKRRRGEEEEKGTHPSALV